MKACALTTIDNPWSPFTQFRDWYNYDESHDYGSCSIVDRLSHTTDDMTLVEEANAPYWKFVSQEEYDNLTTSISAVTKKAPVKAIFNVAGQQVKTLQRGLNIVDGQKVYVK